MSIRTSKSKRIKFGFFKTEKKALERVEHKKKHTALPSGHVGDYYVIKTPRRKAGQNSWMAYCLHRKDTSS